MLSYETARDFYTEIQKKATSFSSDEDFGDFYRDFLKNAAAYAMTRTAWSFMVQALRNEEDAARTIQHNAFISSLDAVCRNLGLEVREAELMPDRKAKGDFACYIALFLALEQR